jgi:hypothetical protein
MLPQLQANGLKKMKEAGKRLPWNQEPKDIIADPNIFVPVVWNPRFPTTLASERDARLVFRFPFSIHRMVTLPSGQFHGGVSLPECHSYGHSAPHCREENYEPLEDTLWTTVPTKRRALRVKPARHSLEDDSCPARLVLERTDYSG